MVTAMRGVADLEEFPAFGERLAIEQNLLVAARARTPAIERMFSALAISLVVAVGPVGRGRTGVVLLDAPAHFRDEKFLRSVLTGASACSQCAFSALSSRAISRGRAPRIA